MLYAAVSHRLNGRKVRLALLAGASFAAWGASLALTSSAAADTTTTYVYDATNDTLQSADTFTTAGHGAAYMYDAQNLQMDLSTDSAGTTTTTYAYDALNRTAQPTDNLTTPGTVTATAYDPVTGQIWVASVPEPKTLALLVIGGLGLLLRTRKTTPTI